MSHELINAYAALISRLEAAIADGTKIPGCTMTTDLGLSEPITNETLPNLRVFPTEILTPQDVALHGRQSMEFNVMIRMREDPGFGLYDDTKSRGLLWLFEKVVNEIDGSDLLCGGAWSLPPKYTIRAYVANETALQYDLEVKIYSAKFTRGNL